VACALRYAGSVWRASASASANDKADAGIAAIIPAVTINEANADFKSDKPHPAVHFADEAPAIPFRLQTPAYRALWKYS
jgi:hypothetical protein